MSPWVERHRPKSFEDIRGQDEAIEKIKRFINEFNSEKTKKALVLHGPPGTGKTTLAHVSAIETNSEIFELNASDLRNREKLHEILRPATEQRSLTKANKIILATFIIKNESNVKERNLNLVFIPMGVKRFNAISKKYAEPATQAGIIFAKYPIKNIVLSETSFAP